MNGFVELLTSLLIEAGTPAHAISPDARLELPGWFRAEKKWDLIVIADGELLAAAEFKSQIGPSFGNNFNNRAEEAIGNATDLWAAYREGAFKPSSRPWLGYFVLLEDCPRSASPVASRSPHFPAFSEFEGASYQQRYAILTEKLLRERLYDGACLLLADKERSEIGQFREPHAELTFEKFVAGCIARVVGHFRR
jgi:hypothetical protein